MPADDSFGKGFLLVVGLLTTIAWLTVFVLVHDEEVLDEIET